MYLQSSASQLERRILAQDGGASRPLLADTADAAPAMHEKLAKLPEERKALYESADCIVHIDGDKVVGSTPVQVRTVHYSSVLVLAEILVRSPHIYFIFLYTKLFVGSKNPKNVSFNSESKIIKLLISTVSPLIIQLSTLSRPLIIHGAFIHLIHLGISQ